MFSRKKQSKMAVFKDSNNNAVKEVIPHFCFSYDLDRNGKRVFSSSYDHFLDTSQVPMLQEFHQIATTMSLFAPNIEQ